MTVSTLTNKVTYTGNGSATSFAVPFKVLDVDHLVVQRLIAATGALDHTYIGTDYSYSGVGSDSGTLTLSGTALSSTYKLVIERTVPYTQELDLVNSGGFYPETVEEQLDLTTMQIQQVAALAEDVEDRALMVPAGETAPVLPVHPEEAGYALVTTEAGLDWDALNLTVTSVDGDSVSSRVLLRGISGPVANQTAYLTEAGREGWFKFSTSNLSAEVTADSREGIYVAPSAAPTGASGAWVRVIESDVVQASWWGLTGDGVANDQPAIQAALSHALSMIIELGEGTFGLNTQLIIPTDKWFRGVGTGKTILTPLATYTPRTSNFNQAITCANTSSNIKCTDMTWDGNKVGLGGGASARIHGFVPSGTNFHFARLTAIDTSGYSCWAFGKNSGTPASGVVEDFISTNADIHFETSIVSKVQFVRVHADSGDDDLPNGSAFHPYNASVLVEYIDSSCTGSISSPMNAIADVVDAKVRLINVDIHTDASGANALQPGGPFALDLEIFGGSFTSETGPAATIPTAVTLTGIGAKFSGYAIGLGINAGGVVKLTSCDVTAATADGSNINTWAIYNDGTASVDGVSSLTATGTVGYLYATGGTGGGNDTPVGSEVTLTPAPTGTIHIRQQTAGQVAPTADGTIGSDNVYYFDIFSPHPPLDSDKCHVTVSLHDTAETDAVLGSPSFSAKWANATGVATNCFRVRLRTPASLTGINAAYHFIEFTS